MYNSYLDLLRNVELHGETCSPAETDVSKNRSFSTRELRNVQVALPTDTPQFILNENEKKYLSVEMDWYMDKIEKLHLPPLELSHDAECSRYIPDVSKITTENVNKKLKEMAFDLLDGCVNRAGPNSNYGEMCLRLKNHIGITQLEWIVRKLSKDPGSRQAVAFYNSPNYQYWSNDDFVCTLNQMFTINSCKLNSVVNIRSNDLVNCFRFDMIWYRTFQDIVLAELSKTYPDLYRGEIVCNIASAHYYLKDQEKLEKILDPKTKFLSLNSSI